ncbi:hypothetical protein [Rhodococcus qingshengii]|uniref:hypothetical protein n=1 Tax=Rhodococcus qingshengii TaxID=334542 RepID=UPI001BEC38CE|nr:hypothetical protein [Rhodococcus qingshengii]MBT2273849.1 hypothetical protein [Rhodococcus qingshengii]
MADLTAPPNLPVSTKEISPVIREAVAHIFSSPHPVAFHGTIPVEMITPAHPPQGIDHPHGGYFQLAYVGGGTAEAYGDQIDVMAGARVAGRSCMNATLAFSPLLTRGDRA